MVIMSSVMPALTPSMSHLSSIVSYVSPSRASEQRRVTVLSWVKALIRKSLGAQCYPIGSFALKTYLHEEGMDVSVFFSRAHESSWIQRVVAAFCSEAQHATDNSRQTGEVDLATPTVHPLYIVQQLTVTFATSKQAAVISCSIGGVQINICGNNIPALASVVLFEQVDSIIGNGHLFKRTILLFKAWAVKHTIYGDAQLLSDNFLRTLVLFIFNAYYEEIHTPLQGVLRLLHYLHSFDWDHAALSPYGPVDLKAVNGEGGKIEALTDPSLPYAWPEGNQPLISKATIHQYQTQTKKPNAAAGHGASLSHSSSASSLPRVNSASFLDADASSPTRSNSESNLAGLAQTAAAHAASPTVLSSSMVSSSSGPLSTLALQQTGRYTAQSSPVSVRSSIEDANLPPRSMPPLHQRQSDSTCVAQGMMSAAFRSKSLTSLTELDRPHSQPDTSPSVTSALSTLPNSHGQQHSLYHNLPAHVHHPHPLYPAHTQARHAPHHMPFPPTISAQGMSTTNTTTIPTPVNAALPLTSSRSTLYELDDSEELLESAFSGEGVDDDADDDVEDADAAYLETDVEDEVSIADLYALDSSSTSSNSTIYAVCSLNVLDAIEVGINLGSNVAYQHQYRIRNVLREGYSRLKAAIDESTATTGTAAVDNSDEGIEHNALLCELFDQSLLSAYQEKTYREGKKGKTQTQVTAASSVTAATKEGEERQQQQQQQLSPLDAQKSMDSRAVQRKDEIGLLYHPFTHSLSFNAQNTVLHNEHQMSISSSSSSASSSSSLFSYPVGETSSAVSPLSSTFSASSPSSASPSPSSQANASSLKSTLNPHSTAFVPSTQSHSKPPLPISPAVRTQALAIPERRHPSRVPSPPIIGISPNPSTLHLSSSSSSLLGSASTSPSITAVVPASHSSSNSLQSIPNFTEFDALDGNFNKMLTNLTHARQFETPDMTEKDLVALMIDILTERGSVPVGRMGSLLHDRTNNHSLPATLKEHYGGLKRLLEKHPTIFLIGKDHPYNPHIRLRKPAQQQQQQQGGQGQGKKKLGRRRTRVRRSANRGSNSNIAAMSSSQYPNPNMMLNTNFSPTLANSSNTSGGGGGATQLYPTAFPPSVLSPASLANSRLTSVLAIDCEMVGVGMGGLVSKLARVSIVNLYGESVYDAFVQPTEPVTDYRTHVSGIRAIDLQHGVEFTVVQREVAGLIKNKILVGHSLLADLQALCLSHPRHLLRDTAHVKLLCPVRPLPLKRLVKERLGMDIQEAEHSSIEDAAASMLLYRSIAKVWEESISHNQQQQSNLQQNEQQTTTVYHLL